MLENTSPMQPTAQFLKDELEGVSLKVAALAGYRKSLEQRKSTLLKSVGEAKARDALREEIARVFNALQNKTHHRSVGTYEELLSYLLRDVLPEEGTIHLKPEYKSNETWLDLFVKKPGSNYPEELEANGGALTNVVSTGLRFISLAKTNNRKLLILDEPDCWVEESRVESFYKVISEVSTSVGFQTFFISHKPAHMFESSASVVLLKREYLDELENPQEANLDQYITEPLEASEDAASAGIVPRKYRVVVENRSLAQKEWESDSQVGIRCIELINVRQHSHTLIPCFPGANALIGGNNVGKSTAIISALRAICYGECTDSLIQHDKSEAFVILHLEDHKKLQLSRKKGRSPPLIFSLFQNGELIKEGKVSRKNSVPDWVTEIIGISKVDELDIQLVSQKTPVFLLEESAPKRAKILSVGTEAENLNKLMKIYDGIKVEDRETIKKGEIELDLINSKLSILSKVVLAEEFIAELSLEYDQMWDNFSFLDKANSHITALSSALNMFMKWNLLKLGSIQPSTLNVPQLKDNTRLLAFIKEIAAVPKIVPEVSFPVVPVLKDGASIIFHGKALVSAIKKAKWGPVPDIDWDSLFKSIQSLDNSKNSSILKIGVEITKAEQDLRMSKTSESQAKAQLTEAENKLHDLVEKLGGVCPTCQQSWPKDGEK